MLNIFGRKSTAVSSDTPTAERREIIKQFKEGKIEFICNFGVLTTGFDAPKTNHIVICRPTASAILLRF